MAMSEGGRIMSGRGKEGRDRRLEEGGRSYLIELVCETGKYDLSFVVFEMGLSGLFELCFTTR